MEDPDLYELSTRIGALVQGAKCLMGLNALRYHHFVNGSDRGFDCTYAKLTSREFHRSDELERLRAQLESLQRQVTGLLAELPTTLEDPRWLQNLELEERMKRGE